MIAFLFPGQGSQIIGMGKDIYEKYEKAKKMYERVSEICEKDIAKMSFEGTQEELNKTENAQLAIATMSLAILEVLKENGITSQINVGLSLGEYVALMDGGFLSLEEGMKLLKQRGYLMGNRIPKEEYKMAAVMGLEASVIEDICFQMKQEGKFVIPANYNYSGQTVISGNANPVKEAISKLQEAGAKRVVELATSGPFHTEKLEEAKKEFEKELIKVNFQKGHKKVIKNQDGEFYQEGDNLKEILANHMIKPVRFDKAIQKMREEKVDTYLEIGPGKTLAGFIKKEDREANVKNISNIEQLEQILEN